MYNPIKKGKVNKYVKKKREKSPCRFNVYCRRDKMYYCCFENTQFNPSECFVIEDFSKPSSYSDWLAVWRTKIINTKVTVLV